MLTLNCNWPFWMLKSYFCLSDLEQVWLERLHRDQVEFTSGFVTPNDAVMHVSVVMTTLDLNGPCFKLGKLPLIQLDCMLVAKCEGELKINILVRSSNSGCFGRSFRVCRLDHIVLQCLQLFPHSVALFVDRCNRIALANMFANARDIRKDHPMSRRPRSPDFATLVQDAHSAAGRISRVLGLATREEFLRGLKEISR